MRKGHWIWILATFLFLFGCEQGEQGDEGSPGNTGVEGPTGKTGPSGQSGVDGELGVTGTTGGNAACYNNQAPVINEITAETDMVVSRTYTITIEASDADPNTLLTYNIVMTNGIVTPGAVSGAFQFTPTQAGGPFTFTALVSDGCQAVTQDFRIRSINAAGWSYVGTPMTIPIGTTNFSLQVNNNIPYLAFTDNWAQGKISVMAYSSGQWNYVGQPGIAGNGTAWLKVFADQAIPYFAYIDPDDSLVRAMKFNGTDWEYLGGPIGTYNGALEDFNRAAMVVENNTMYVAFIKEALPNPRPSVYFYNGSTGGWNEIGEAVSEDEASSLALAVYEQIPYVAFVDLSDSRLKVKYYNGSWISLGGYLSDPGSMKQISMVIDQGTPYVAYVESSEPKIKVFDRTDQLWKNIEPQNVFPFVNLKPYPLGVYAGVPYTLVCDDEDEALNRRLLKYSGTGIEWERLGNPTFYDVMPVEFVEMAMDRGIVYIAFMDVTHFGSLSIVKYVE